MGKKFTEKNKFEITLIGAEETESEKCKEYTYIFDRREIKMKIDKNFIRFSFEMKTDKSFDDVLKYEPTQPLSKTVNHAIKSAFLIHIIKYSKHISIRTVTAKIDDEEEVIFDSKENNSGNFPIFSLINGSLLKGHEFPESWSTSRKISEAILSRRVTDFNSLDSALFALIYSKSKEYETERLVYLWMAMNGMYNHFAKMVNGITNVNIPPDKDSEQMKAILKFYDLGKTYVFRNDKENIARKVISVLKDYRGDITKETLSADKELADNIYSQLTDENGNPKYNITPYGYLLFELPYYYRCKIFHANKPIYFFSYENEVNIRCLRIINNLMEEFLQTHLIEWFEDDFVTAVNKRNRKKGEVSIDEIDSPIKTKIKEVFQ